jgi:hypothetical protein
VRSFSAGDLLAHGCCPRRLIDSEQDVSAVVASEGNDGAVSPFDRGDRRHRPQDVANLFQRRYPRFTSGLRDPGVLHAHVEVFGRPRPSSTPIIASVTQSSPAIASICAPCAEAAWSRSVCRRVRHRSSEQNRAVTHHDTSPRIFFGHHGGDLHADASHRNDKPCSQNLAAILPSIIFGQ